MAFIKITEQPSLYNDLEKKPIRELLEDINEEDPHDSPSFHFESQKSQKHFTHKHYINQISQNQQDV